MEKLRNHPFFSRFVSIDTEFPGVVYEGDVTLNDTIVSHKYNVLRANVNRLRLGG